MQTKATFTHWGWALCLAACGGGATFKMVETPWQGGADSTARLQKGAEKLGCSASAPDSTGEIEIRCPQGKPDPKADEGTIRIGPAADGVMVAMCNDGMAEGCSAVLERIWGVGGT